MPTDLLSLVNAADAQVRIVIFDDEHDRVPKRWDGRLVDHLGRAPVVRPVKTGAPCYSGVLYLEGATRGLAGVEIITLLIYDFDHLTEAQYQQLLARLAGRAHAIHSSFSDRAGGDDDRCVRVILILTRPITPAEYRVIRVAVLAELGVPADRRAADVSRIWFAPSTRPERADSAFITYATGTPLDPTTYLAEPAPSRPQPSSAAPLTVTTPAVASTTGPATTSGLSVRDVRSRLRRLSDPESRALAQRVMGGETFAQWGERNDALWRFMNIAARIAPEASWEVLVEIVQPSLAVMASEHPEGALTTQDAAEMAGRALQRAHDEGIRVFERGDEAEIAGHLVEALTTTEPVVFDEGQFWRYSADSGLWDTVLDEEISRVIQRLAGARVLKDQHTAVLRISANVVRGSRELAAARAKVPGFFDNAVPGFVFSNGFVRVDATGIHLESHSPGHRARFGYPFPFDATAAAPRFRQFRAEVFDGDADAEQKNQCLQEFTGLSLIGRATRPAKALVLIGEGRNGKSTYQEIISAPFPESARGSVPPHCWEQEYYRELLRGKLLNLVPELPKADIMRSEAFKAITAGDIIVGRAIRQAPVRFRPLAGHLFAANSLPAVDDASRAFWARVVLIPFSNEFSVDKGNADTDLAATIIADELPGIILWALEGAARLLARGPRAGYTIPSSHHAALAEWRLRADQVAEFLSEMTTPTTTSAMRTPGRLLFDTYVAWAKRDGHRPLASNNFGVRVKALGVPWAKPDKQILYSVALTPEANRIREAANRRVAPEYRPDPVIPSFRRDDAGNPRLVAPMAQVTVPPVMGGRWARRAPAAATATTPTATSRRGSRHGHERSGHGGPPLDGEGRHALLRGEPGVGLPSGAVGSPP